MMVSLAYVAVRLPRTGVIMLKIMLRNMMDLMLSRKSEPKTILPMALLCFMMLAQKLGFSTDRFGCWACAVPLCPSRPTSG